jgi:hypothetical protein
MSRHNRSLRVLKYFLSYIGLAFATTSGHAAASPLLGQAKNAAGAARMGTNGSVVYGGGPVLSNVRLVSVMWGPNVDPTVAIEAAGFYKAVVNSTFMDFLAEYNTPTQRIGRGTYAGTFTIAPSNTSTLIQDGDIGPELAFQIQAGHLPAPNDNTLYVIHFPPGVTIVSGGEVSCVDFCAYHWWSTQQISGTNQRLVYAVIPDFSPASVCYPGPPGASEGCGDTSEFDAVTQAASHEIAEATTDPTGSGWEGEIGDPCNYYPMMDASHAVLANNGRGFTVQTLWSQASQACVGQDGFLAPSQLVTRHTHACYLPAVGSLECWGDDTLGELGDGSVASTTTPVIARRITDPLDVAIQDYGTCVIDAQRGVSCWSSSARGLTAIPNVASALAIAGKAPGDDGGTSMCALSLSGVQCWGENVYLLPLGDGASSVPGLSNAIGLTVGQRHACALISGGQVKCWGSGDEGELGPPAGHRSASPVTIASLPQVLSISAGALHTCALSFDGRVSCWGDNELGQLGDPALVNTFYDVPSPVRGLTNVTDIAAGAYFNCALLSDETVRCWGSNYYGQLGDGTTVDSATPVTVAGLSHVRSLAAGLYSACAATAGGAVECWGFGPLGNGTQGPTGAPVVAQTQNPVPLPRTATYMLAVLLVMGAAFGMSRASRKR